MFIRETGTDEVVDLWEGSDQIFCVNLGYLEVRGVIARRLTRSAARHAWTLLEDDRAEVEEIDVDGTLIAHASDLIDAHGLRAFDALHLAAAVELGDPELVVATWDAELARAASAEGFSVAPTG